MVVADQVENETAAASIAYPEVRFYDLPHSYAASAIRKENTALRRVQKEPVVVATTGSLLGAIL